MALVSSKVAAGIEILASHMNNLWTDLTQNHDHSSGQGGTVDHGDLSDGNISGTTYDHSEIDTHVDGTQGIHGAHSSLYMAGAVTADMAIVFGTFSGSSGSGTAYYSDDGAAPADITFSSAPMVFLQVLGDTGDATRHRVILDVTSRTTTTFDWEADDPATSSYDVMFVAIGTKS